MLTTKPIPEYSAGRNVLLIISTCGMAVPFWVPLARLGSFEDLGARKHCSTTGNVKSNIYKPVTETDECTTGREKQKLLFSTPPPTNTILFHLVLNKCLGVNETNCKDSQLEQEGQPSCKVYLHTDGVLAILKLPYGSSTRVKSSRRHKNCCSTHQTSNKHLHGCIF